MTEMMLVTTHEVASLLQSGGGIMCRFESGTEALLRRAGAPLDPESLAEQRAMNDGLPIVQLSIPEIGEVAHGRSVLVTALGGQGAVAVQVRMMTPEELLAAHAQACRAYGDEPRMSYADAERLTATL